MEVFFLWTIPTFLVMAFNPMAILGGLAAGAIYSTRWKILAIVPGIAPLLIFLSLKWSGDLGRTEIMLSAMLICGVILWAWAGKSMVELSRRRRNTTSKV